MNEDVEQILSFYWTDKEFLNELLGALEQNDYEFCVAEEDNSEIVGVAGLRPTAKFLRVHAETDNPVELYVIASKYAGSGIGSFLIKNIQEKAREQGYTELICYSPETHEDSWKFYERNKFKKDGIVKDPDDGYPGMLWKKTLQQNKPD